MPSTYHDQRDALLAISPLYADLLPEAPPTGPMVPRLDLTGWRECLGEAANNHASLAVVIGWGDGTLVRLMADDPLLCQRDVLIALLPGEEDAFAAAIAQDPPLLPSLQRLKPVMFRVRNEADAQALCDEHFRTHESLPRLAGCDLIDRHPLTAEAMAARQRLAPVLVKALSDRPQMYGNDIMDSFTGLVNAAANAPRILPAPSLGECWGMFGETPVISIAGGPSLGRHIDRLRALQDRCILVACDSVLPGLIKAGIQPHFCTPIERLPATVDLVQAARGTRTIFAGSCVVPPGALDPFEGRAIGVAGGDQLYVWLDHGRDRRVNTGSSTGVFSFMVGSALTSGPVYLVGHDLARNRDASHWDGANYSSGLWAEQKAKVAASARVNTGYEDRLVPGNDGQPLPSIVWWDRFRNEIAGGVRELSAIGRTVYNVNAHDRIGALIDGTVAAPLPDPQDLPELGPVQLPPAKPERFEDWRLRARRLPEDGQKFRDSLRTLRDDLAATRLRPVEEWNLDALAARLSLNAQVSEGNRWAFNYFLRSALHNSTAQMHLRRRTPSTARFKWMVLDAMDGLCHSLDNAMNKLAPKLQEIADVHA